MGHVKDVTKVELSLEWWDKFGYTKKTFDNIQDFADFLKNTEHVEIAEKLKYPLKRTK